MLRRNNVLDNTPLEFAHTGWLIIHAAAICLLIFLGILAKDRLTN